MVKRARILRKEVGSRQMPLFKGSEARVGCTVHSMSKNE